MTNSALGLMRASSSLRMEIEASSSFKKEGHVDAEWGHGRAEGSPTAAGGMAHYGPLGGSLTALSEPPLTT